MIDRHLTLNNVRDVKNQMVWDKKTESYLKRVESFEKNETVKDNICKE